MKHSFGTWVMWLLISVIVVLTGNIPLVLGERASVWGVLSLLAGFLFFNIKPSPAGEKIEKRRLRICRDGCELLRIFQISLAGSLILVSGSAFTVLRNHHWLWLWNLLTVFLAEAVVFWNGMIRVYLSSAQIGIKWRIIGLLCGWLPIVNLVVLNHLIHLASEEAVFENQKMRSNQERVKDKICDTRYPILMVHGVFFRDFRYFNYWGRIPGELKKNGARIYYGNHQSAAAVKDSGEELRRRILGILEETGAGKVNIIAHSKGGLDSRYAISKLGMAPFVASLTTINTPHRGCEFADYLLDKIPKSAQQKVADGYQAALRKMGDDNPDFLAAVQDLTASACRKFNAEVPDQPEVFYQSVGSKLNVASGGRFPLNFSYQLVKYFDGDNDGLVSEASFPWGASYQYLMVDGKRGISHGDMIDLNRENIPGFDVREFYVELVRRLKNQGF